MTMFCILAVEPEVEGQLGNPRRRLKIMYMLIWIFVELEFSSDFFGDRIE
jgi:hypothetical protein